MSEHKIIYKKIMTDTDVKEWLNRAYKLDPVIQKDIEELNRINSLIDAGFGIDYEKPNVQTSPKREAPFEQRVDNLIEYKNLFEENLVKLLNIKIEIRNAINKLDNALERNVLILRHCHFMKWIDIAVAMNYSQRRCFDIYDQAIINVKTILKDNR